MIQKSYFQVGSPFSTQWFFSCDENYVPTIWIRYSEKVTFSIAYNTSNCSLSIEGGCWIANWTSSSGKICISKEERLSRNTRLNKISEWSLNWASLNSHVWAYYNLSNKVSNPAIGLYYSVLCTVDTHLIYIWGIKLKWFKPHSFFESGWIPTFYMKVLLISSPTTNQPSFFPPKLFLTPLNSKISCHFHSLGI